MSTFKQQFEQVTQMIQKCTALAIEEGIPQQLSHILCYNPEITIEHLLSVINNYNDNPNKSNCYMVWELIGMLSQCGGPENSEIESKVLSKYEEWTPETQELVKRTWGEYTSFQNFFWSVNKKPEMTTQ